MSNYYYKKYSILFLFVNKYDYYYNNYLQLLVIL